MSADDGSALPPPSGPAQPGPGEAGSPAQPRVVVSGRQDGASADTARGRGRPRDGTNEPSRRGPTPRVLAIGALSLLVTAVVVTQAVRKRGDDRASGTSQAATAGPTTAVDATTSAGGGSTTTITLPPSAIDSAVDSSGAPAGSSIASSAVPPAPATSAPAPATAAPATAAPATTAAIESPTTVAPPAPEEPTPPADGRVVAITSRVEECGFGPRCLIAGFTLQGFGAQPATFTCIFSNGTRREFNFGARTVKRACTTGRIPDSITIEVAGVRSNTVSISR